MNQPDTPKGIFIAACKALASVAPEQGSIAAMQALANFASADVDAHTCESPRGSNSGKELRKFFKADNLQNGPDDTGYPWCAAAVSYWVQTWLAKCPAAAACFGHIAPPRTARAFGLLEWAEASQGCVWLIPGAALASGAQRALPGDIAVLHISHCGIVLAATGTVITCIEGNTDRHGSREGWECARRARTPSQLRAVLRMIPRPIKDGIHQFPE